MKVYMFHYVSKNFNYYHYDLDLFDKTICYLSNNYKIISLKEFNSMIENKIQITDNYVMLTFDDGTIDHYQNVYPILKKYNCSGLFFIPSCIFKNKVLDIQIIHQLLSKNDENKLLNELITELNKNNIVFDQQNLEKNFDNKKAALFKQLLQYKLDKTVRKKMLNYFIKKYNISNYANDYYMNIDQLKEMKNNNMFFGLHTDTHPRLDKLLKDEQISEIKNNMKYLLDNNLLEKDMISIAYPFGKYNDITLQILKDEQIKYGFKLNDEGISNNLLINRIDCKYLGEKINEELH